MFCYHSNKKASLKVLYFPLEETPERIMQRFISWLLYIYSDKKIRVSPRELRSTTSVLPQEILDIIETPEIQDIIKYFEDNVIFMTDTNPTGIYKACKQYAEEHGTTYTKNGKYKDEFGVVRETQVFDRYEQDNPDEIRIIIIDTVNIIDTERGLTLKQSIDKTSEYLAKYLRNRYHFSPVVIQQQAMEGENLEAIKLNKIKPAIATAGDSKYIARDANIVLGLFSPFKFSLREYEGYDITKFRDNIRFLEVLVNRDSEMGGICPLFFDGAVCQFNELPRPDNKEELQKIYRYLESLKSNSNTTNKSKLFFIHKLKNFVKSLTN